MGWGWINKSKDALSQWDGKLAGTEQLSMDLTHRHQGVTAGFLDQIVTW